MTGRQTSTSRWRSDDRRQASACRHNSSLVWRGARDPGAPKAPPAGRAKPWRPCASSDISRITAILHGPRRRRTIQGASTTSHS